MKGSGILAPMVNRQSSGPFVERSDKVGTYQVERIIRVGCRVSGDNTEGAARQAELIELDAWVVLEMLGQQVTVIEKPEANQKDEPCVQVEYDLAFWGGDYSSIHSEYVHIPVRLVEQLRSVEDAFVLVTGESRRHIISYSESEHFTRDGEPWEEQTEKEAIEMP